MRNGIFSEVRERTCRNRQFTDDTGMNYGDRQRGDWIAVHREAREPEGRKYAVANKRFDALAVPTY